METPPLELWEAESFVTVLTNGRTKPIQIEVFRRDEAGKRQRLSVLTKSLGHPEISSNWSLIAELMGNLLATHFSIQTPNPVLVNLSPDFVGIISQNETYKKLSEGAINLQPGLAAGCQYLQGLAPFIPPINLTLPKEQEWARRIFAFDMLVQNPDRRQAKPNAALLNREVLAYDFELCFSFVYDLPFLRRPAWEIQPKTAKDHLFYPGLVGKMHDWRPFMKDLASLDCDKIEQTFGKLLAAFPVTNDYATQAVCHLRDVQREADKFRIALERNLV